MGVSLDAIANDGEAAENDNCLNAENATGGSGNDTLVDNGARNL